MAVHQFSPLENRLSAESLALIRKAGALAAERGLRIYLVGGVVRDILMNRPSLDLDLVVEGDAVGLAESLAREADGRVVIHRRFSTAKIRFASLIVDVAMARAETYAYPGALPSVRPGSIRDDLARRDFTVNAMALRLARGGFDELVDPFGGQGDLDKGFIRVLHDRSFIDDATRMLRAVRYEQRFGFRLEVGTEELLRRDAAMLHGISGDRLRHELEMILKEEHPEKALKRAGELGLLSEVYPALRGNGWLARTFGAAREAGIPSPLTLQFALLTYRLSEPQCEELISRLKTPGTISRAVRDTVRLRRQLPSLARPRLAPSAVVGLLQEYSPTSVQACAVAADSPLARERLNLYLTRWRHVRTGLDGSALLKLGVPAGPELGRVLKMLRDAKLDGKIVTREDEIELVRRWLSPER